MVTRGNGLKAWQQSSEKRCILKDGMFLVELFILPVLLIVFSAIVSISGEEAGAAGTMYNTLGRSKGDSNRH